MNDLCFSKTNYLIKNNLIEVYVVLLQDTRRIFYHDLATIMNDFTIVFAS